MGKKIGLFLGLTILGGLIWYLFLKPYDYVVRFEIKATPGTINQSLKAWGSRIDSSQFIGQNSLNDLQFRFTFNDSIQTQRWKITSLNDSISKIRVYASDVNHSLANRMAIPFSTTDFEKRTTKVVIKFVETIQEHLKDFKVSITGTSKIAAKYCACVAQEGIQSKKADGMRDYYPLLSGLMAAKNIQLDGRPLIEVTRWNIENDSIYYNFCFPVIKTDSLPKNPEVFYKYIEEKNAIRAIYNGNYITSDRAWYALLEYADKNNITVAKKPFEIFHTNPNMGGNALEWEAEIFMPILK